MGIIGGADGPTVIFVTSTFSWGWMIGGIVALAGVITAILIRRKKSKEKTALNRQ